MNLRDLQYLIAVAELKHFGRAAEHCHVSQPTLSAQIKKLEEFLGIQLIERNNKQVIITPAGLAIVNRARSILREVNAIRDIARQASNPLAGPIKIGIIPTLGPYLLPHIVPILNVKFPKLELLLHEDQTARLVEALKQGDLDTIILALPIDDENLQSHELFREPFYVALPASHPLQTKISLQISDLADQTLLLLAEGHCMRDQALEVCSLANIKEKIDFSATSLETLRQMVAAGAGITLLPKLALQFPIANQTAICIRPFQSPMPFRTIGMVWRKSAARAETFTTIAEVLAKQQDYSK